jgi:hypothetical protein
MDLEECYKWGELFSCEWKTKIKQMAERASTLGLVQEEIKGILIWKKDKTEQCRWVFVEDPSNVESIRNIYANDQNIKSPACYIIVKQPDPSDNRGDIIFDIFRLNSISYLWHFNRVFTKPIKQ